MSDRNGDGLPVKAAIESTKLRRRRAQQAALAYAETRRAHEALDRRARGEDPNEKEEDDGDDQSA
jgi:hypothetical protein